MTVESAFMPILRRRRAGLGGQTSEIRSHVLLTYIHRGSPGVRPTRIEPISVQVPPIAAVTGSRGRCDGRDDDDARPSVHTIARDDVLREGKGRPKGGGGSDR